MATEFLVQQLESIVPSLVGMLCNCNVDDVQAVLALAETLVGAAMSELASRSVSPAQEKAIIDAATQAAIDAKFGGKP